MVQFQREFTSDLRQLKQMREFVRDACLRAYGTNTDDEFVQMLQLAVDEAAANIILHAYEGANDRPIELVLQADGDQVCVNLYHCGKEFDPLAVPVPTFNGSRESGFGLYLIGRTVDEVNYERDDRGRCGIRLVKRKPPEEGNQSCK
jgi:anti-sigma regulatory factor (Ser/Thr protein kinase)